jgi:hypothetical protein
MNALLDLLTVTADKLAAEWDLRSEAAVIEAVGNDGGGLEPTIQ